MGVVTDLQPIAVQTVIATLYGLDERGGLSLVSTTNLTQCHIEIGNDRVLDSNGNEVVSRGSVFSLEDNSLFPGVNDSGQEYRFTLPNTWPKPRDDLRAINVIRNVDDEGEAYEEIVL